MVRVSVLDLERRITVVRADDDGRPAFPHVLRGVLAAMLAEPTWHVVVAFADGLPLRPEVTEVLDQAKRWAGERECALTVTSLRDVVHLTAFEA